MTQPELLAAFKKLPPKERLEVVEAVLHTLQEEFPTDHVHDDAKRLSDAAAALLDDYKNNEELTSFTALDGEAVCE